MFVHEQLFMAETKPLGYEIRLTANQIKCYIDQKVTVGVGSNLTGIEGMTMGFLFHHKNEEVTCKRLMERDGASKATVSQTLKGLEKKGFIEMVHPKDDKRKKIISLTPKGQEIEREFDEIFKEINQNIESGLDEKEIETLRSLLMRIRENVSMEK